MPLRSFLKHYADILWLLAGIIAGCLLGSLFPEQVMLIKPVGDIFLNLLFTAVIPLVFFAITSAIANLGASRETGRLIGIMLLVFAGTVILAILITLVAALLFPITQNITGIPPATVEKTLSAGEQITRLLTVSEFFELLSRKNMLALIIFSLLTGTAALRSGAAGAAFRQFLSSGNEVMKAVLRLVMLAAPLGLGAYFAYQVAAIGPQLFGAYAQALALGHGVSLFYYLLFFSAYALLAGGMPALIRYWRYNLTPSLTALGTCSSVATIPANLQAGQRMGIPAPVGDVVIPLGASLHKEGSAIAAVIKVVVALALVNKGVDSLDTILTAILIAFLVSIIEGGIPNGGYVGQLLVVSAYQLPLEVLPVIMIIGTLLDPIATLLNATGDTAAGLVVSRLLSYKRKQPA